MSKTIALDIGHGDNTFPPGKGVYKNGEGYAEFDFNNKLGKWVKMLLEQNGFDVIMAQPFDSGEVGLVNRTNYYDSKRPDLGISLHANAGNASVGGRCAFYWTTSNQGRQFATNIINNMTDMGYGIHGNGLHASDYGSWTNLHIIRESTTFPMVLVEHGFMTNDLDFPLIFGNRQDEYIEDMAEADVKAVCDYFGVPFSKSDSKPSEPSTGDKEPPYTIGEWSTNDYGTQWIEAKGTFTVGGSEITLRNGSPFLSAPSPGTADPGATIKYHELARQDDHVWVGYYTGEGGLRYCPYNTWDSVSGTVGPEPWGTFS